MAVVAVSIVEFAVVAFVPTVVEHVAVVATLLLVLAVVSVAPAVLAFQEAPVAL